jgi:5-methylcytosine-specific restriction endonuclease McrA
MIDSPQLIQQSAPKPNGNRKEVVRRYYLKHREKIRQKQREEYLKNKSTFLERTGKWAKAHPDKTRAKQSRYHKAHLELSHARSKQYRELHPEKMRALRIAWESRNKEYRRDYNRTWRSKNEHRIRHYSSKRRILLQAEADVNLQVMQDFISAMKSKRYGRCYYCEKKVLTSKMHLDHIVPLSKGGQHRVENLCFTCPHCNLTKHDKSIGQWIKVGQQILAL